MALTALLVAHRVTLPTALTCAAATTSVLQRALSTPAQPDNSAAAQGPLQDVKVWGACIVDHASPQAQQHCAVALRCLQVLDLGQVVAGNFCGALLAYFGADVIKVTSGAR
jgi:hypothetical protein